MLDSTSPVGVTLNTDRGRPETTSAGVLRSFHTGREEQWFVLRATYARELKVKAELEERGVRCFVPMIWRKRTTEGHEEKKLVPAVSSLVFVCWTREELDAYIRSFAERRPVNYYWDRTADRPLTVPDKPMQDFITVASSMDEDLIYLTEISEKLREGQVVRVKNGPFKGVEGKIVRIKKSRRVMVELPGSLAIASTFVSPADIEIN